MTAAAFTATFSDWKLVKTRGVVQLVFEIPVEKADLAYKVVGGMPAAAKERWFGIARLKDDGGASPSREAEVDNPPGGGPASRSWHEMLPATQAGILCNDPAFHKFLQEYCAKDWQDWRHIDNGAESAASCVRQICEVQSRRDILPRTAAADKWREIAGLYRAWHRSPEIV